MYTTRYTTCVHYKIYNTCTLQYIQHVYTTRYTACVHYKIYNMCTLQDTQHVYTTRYTTCVHYKIYNMCTLHYIHYIQYVYNTIIYNTCVHYSDIQLMCTLQCMYNAMIYSICILGRASYKTLGISQPGRGNVSYLLTGDFSLKPRLIVGRAQGVASLATRGQGAAKRL